MKQMAAMVGAVDVKNPMLMTVAAYILKNGVQGTRAVTNLLLDWTEVEAVPHKGVIIDVGQTKVDRLQVGEKQALQCPSDCTGGIPRFAHVN